MLRLLRLNRGEVDDFGCLRILGRVNNNALRIFTILLYVRRCNRLLLDGCFVADELDFEA